MSCLNQVCHLLEIMECPKVASGMIEKYQILVIGNKILSIAYTTACMGNFSPQNSTQNLTDM